MNIFVNHEEYRPRAGWRLGIQFILFLIFSLLLFVLKDRLVSQSLYITRALIMTIATLSSIYIAAKFLDRRSITNYGIRLNGQWGIELITGLAIGTVAISGVFLFAWASGWVTITGYGWQKIAPLPYSVWLASYFGAMLLVGFYEELLFRGYQLINMTEGLLVERGAPGTAAAGAVVLSSVIFGLMHTGNMGASWISTVNVMLAGIVLAIPFLLTGRLALSIGLHVSWNFVQGGIWGMAVSGNLFRGSLFQVKHHGPSLYTGGSFGPEAGLLGIGGLMLMLVLTCLFVKITLSDYSLHYFLSNLYSKSPETHEQRS